jgi:hypothetical protein
VKTKARLEDPVRRLVVKLRQKDEEDRPLGVFDVEENMFNTYQVSSEN